MVLNDTHMHAHTQMLHGEQMNTSAMNGKTEVLSRETVTIKKETNGNFRTEKYHI